MDQKVPSSYLMHYGVKERSGRYPWGSGEDKYQRLNRPSEGVKVMPWLTQYREYEKQGKSEAEIVALMGEKSTTTLRRRLTSEIGKEKQKGRYDAQHLKDKGWNNTKIAEQLGVSEGTVRNWLKPRSDARQQLNDSIKDMIRGSVKENRYVDVGLGVENSFGITRTRLQSLLSELESEGYHIHKANVEQLGTGKQTTNIAITAPDVDYKEFVDNRFNIAPLVQLKTADGDPWWKLKPPENIDSDRVAIRYAEDGGTDMDGVIQIRRGVEDLSLGENNYAQVRIGVDGTHYLKGMAIYADNLPEGVDIMFNTNKHKGTPKMDVLKPQSENVAMPNNPFGAAIRQKEYVGADGETHLSAINFVNEEVDWEKWGRNLPTQMLSKQPVALVKERLDATYADKQAGFDEIMALTNPEVKRNLLDSYADSCDSDAVHMKAKAFSGQSTHVLLPVTSISESECYAPNYEDGTPVVLIRYPHGGRFEIPQLKVNNKNAEGKSVISNSATAIGINPKTAAQLSGADFDGDTVTVIPNADGKIKVEAVRKELQDFDPKESYPKYEGMKVMTEKQKGIQMGVASNLITDMTLRGAEEDEITRAVKYSMVVIDAKKHKLDWKQAEKDFGIKELKDKYQGHYNEQGRWVTGASTLISRAKADVDVLDRKEVKPDPETGERRYVYTGKEYVFRDEKVLKRDPHDPNFVKTQVVEPDPKTGEMKEVTRWVGTVERVVPKTSRNGSTRMAEAKDARELITPGRETQVELLYADYANKMKAMANEARKQSLKIETYKKDPSAARTYAEEVARLEAELNEAYKNAPLEREAQRLANKKMALVKDANPEIKDDKDKIKKYQNLFLKEARAETGAKKEKITLTPYSWEAIQARAISANKLRQILKNADPDVVKAYATPRTATNLTPAEIANIKAMAKSGNITNAQIAQKYGISATTVSTIVKA